MILFLIILVCFIAAYLFAGAGFALAAWLQASETEVKEGKTYGNLLCRTYFIFVLTWPIVAIYCYKVDVARTWVGCVSKKDG
jgi:hypothetical protein